MEYSAAHWHTEVVHMVLLINRPLKRSGSSREYFRKRVPADVLVRAAFQRVPGVGSSNARRNPGKQEDKQETSQTVHGYPALIANPTIVCTTGP